MPTRPTTQRRWPSNAEASRKQTIELANAALSLLHDARLKVEKRDHPGLVALDIADAMRYLADIKRLKQEAGPNLVTQGSTELVHALLANDLVDALSIFTLPVVLGGGKKLFADGSAPHSFKLTSSRVSSTGILIGHYERDGEIKIGDTGLETPSKREIVRRERMKRED